MRTENAKVRVAALASRQSGRVARRQLERLEVANAVISRWLTQGYLHRVLPRVYAVGHAAPSVEGDLAAAVLYAGPGAMLSHGTAAWWWGLIDRAPSTIQVSTPRRCRPARGIRVHQRRSLARIWRRDLPVTSVAQTCLDFSTVASLNRVRTVLANAEYHDLLDVAAIEALLGRARPGSTKLRTALKRHQPRLAYARSPVEVEFFALCERFGLPVPEVNARVAGWDVDFYWPDHALAVEVDPPGNHHTPAQIDRDRRKDLALRAQQLVVHRYSREQLAQTQRSIAADVTNAIAAGARRSSSARSPAGTRTPGPGRPRA
jgi:predicted transcriptional regulator of viral defense system